ncbi:MAG TPA: LON peptidase substrate-binding domain-containing protein [Propionibacteriaceae bacterium]
MREPSTSGGWVRAVGFGWLAGHVAIMPMFPLSSVLFPYMPLRLRVFEERYLIMLAELLKNEDAQFGVVLIERGWEVGGGEQCFDLGTIAEITQLGAQEGFVGLVAQGGRRFDVTRWLMDAPHPRAEISEIADLEWDIGLWQLREETEQLVRRTLAVASEFAGNVWPADIELSPDPAAAAWQLAAIAPLNALDQVRLLRAGSFEELLGRVSELTQEVVF